MTLLPLWYKGLTPELRRKAEVELGETEDVKEKALKEFRRIIRDDADIPLRLDDAFLLRFLRVKKFNLQKAVKVIKNFYATQSKHKSMFCDKTPTDVMHILEMNCVDMAPYRMPTGAHLIIYRLVSVDFDLATVEDLLTTIFLCGETYLDCEASQVSGGVIVVDMKGMTFRHYRLLLSYSVFSLIFNILQDSWPERVQGIHYVNEPYILHAVFRTIKPFMKQKLKDRIFFHGSDLDSLHSHVPKDLLPEELGGKTGPFDNTQFADHFLSQQSRIQKIYTNYGVS